MGQAKSAVFRALKPFAGCFPTRLLAKISRQPIIFPFYHTVADEHLPHVSHLYKVKDTKQFRDDLDFFLSHFNPISLDTFIRYVKGETTIPDRSFLLSFDDGLREFNDIVAPILHEKGIPCVNFLNSGFIDNQDLFFRYKISLLLDQLPSLSAGQLTEIDNYLESSGFSASGIRSKLLNIPYAYKGLIDTIAAIAGVSFQDFLTHHQPYLSAAEVRTLQAEGFEFGAHSIDHPAYQALPLEEQLRQTAQSMDELADRFFPSARTFAFPFTDDGVPLAFFRAMFEDQLKLDASFGGAGLKIDSYSRNYQRIPMEVDGLKAHQIINLELLYFLVKKAAGQHRILRQ